MGIFVLLFVILHPPNCSSLPALPFLPWVLTRQHVGADQQVGQELFACGGQAGRQGPRLRVRARQDLRKHLPKVSGVARSRDQKIGAWSRGGQHHRWLESGWPLNILFG